MSNFDYINERLLSKNNFQEELQIKKDIPLKIEEIIIKKDMVFKKDLIVNNARKRIIEKFGLNQMLEKTIAVYEGLIAAKQDSNN